MHLLDFASLLLRSSSTWTCEIQPKVRRWFKFTSLSAHASSGISQSKGTDDPLLIRYNVVLTAFAQNCLGNPACIRMLLTRSCIVMFIRSATPFWWGLSGTVFTLRIPWLAQNSSYLSLQYLPPLWDFKYLSFRPHSFSTWANHLKHIEHIDLLQELNPDFSTWIINKGHKIQWASERGNWSLTPYVGMN